MISTFNVENLYQFLHSFYTAVGIRISVFDDEFNLVAEYPKEAPAFCSLVRTTELGKSGCKKCDVTAFKEAKKLRKAHIYTCHAGLTEAVAPIKLDGGILGYIILAHMLPKENYEQSLSNAIEKTTAYGLSEKDILPALKEISSHTQEKICACVEILNAVAAYLQVTDLVKWNVETLANKIAEYIERNLNARLTTDLLCKTFFISRTKLHQISVESYGMSIAKYILFKRIEKAKELLKQNLSVTQVAEKTGFSDFNYFGKTFKKEVGLSPTAYKKTI